MVLPQPFTLIGLDIEGDWNRPLLANAAAISGCDCVLARSEVGEDSPHHGESAHAPGLETALRDYRHVIACERTRRSTNIFELPAPRAKTAIIVGNEARGIPRAAITRANIVACVPMAENRLSSLNVAVAASIILYVLTRDLGRKRRMRTRIRQPDVDVLVHAPADSYEVGSLLRSLHAFGWRRAFLSDPHGVWFTKDPKLILASRAAARRAINSLAVLPAAQLDPSRYDAALVSGENGEGTSLSRLRLPECRRLLVVVGMVDGELGFGIPTMRVNMDYEDQSVPACFRHTGSIFLSVVSQMLVG